MTRGALKGSPGLSLNRCSTVLSPNSSLLLGITVALKPSPDNGVAVGEGEPVDGG